jgi:hypothetical protein
MLAKEYPEVTKEAGDFPCLNPGIKSGVKVMKSVFSYELVFFSGQ